MFIIKDKLPYYLSSDYKKIYPCKIDAFSYTVDFATGEAATSIDAALTENEVRQRLGIYVVKGEKTTNKSVTSESTE